VSAQQDQPATPAAPASSGGPQHHRRRAGQQDGDDLFGRLFLDPKTGIARFNSLLGTLNREFQPRQAELQGLQTRINTLTKEIDDTQTVADPNAIRQKRDQLDPVEHRVQA
jgi:Skp family chaperone for outer membrane proteins